MAFRQLPLKDMRHGLARDLVVLDLSPTTISSRYGIAFTRCNDGFAICDAAVIETDSGNQYGLRRYIESPIENYTSIITHEKSKNLKADLEEFLSVTKISTTHVMLKAPDFDDP